MRRRTLLATVGLAFAAPSLAADPASFLAAIRRDMAPSGRLRAAINYGNIVLANRSAAGDLTGVSVDLARELAGRLDLPLELVPFETAGKVTASAGQDVWDLAFLAIDPVRAGEISFSPPYVLIEGTYLVPEGSPLKAIEDVDRVGVQVAVGRGSAYDLFLTRSLKFATLLRAATSEDAVKLFAEQKLDVAAGVKQPLVLFARDNPGFRVMDGRFMAIEQAMGVPRGRELAARYLSGFIEEMKVSGFVAEALARHHQADAVVAPPVVRTESSSPTARP